MPVLEHFRRGDGPDAMRASRFASAGGATEWHLCLPSCDEATYRDALAHWQIAPETVVFRRWFVADPARVPGPGAAIGQTPLPAGAPALWAYHVESGGSPRVGSVPGGVLLHRPQRGHLWLHGGLAPRAGGVGDQTRALFGELADRLAERGATLRDQLVRTWIFVGDIDDNYGAVVAARTALFAEHGLTAETHYVASTGIGGLAVDPRAAVQLDAHAVIGLDPWQVRYLRAPDHLGPTDGYGVTFERGTRVDHGDRAHVWISGTASIDSAGRSRHRGDVRAQLARALDNVGALLQDAGATVADMAQALIYLRRPDDEAVIRGDLARQLPGVPRLTLHGAVCRPEWLVEIECLAIVEHRDARWPDF